MRTLDIPRRISSLGELFAFLEGRCAEHAVDDKTVFALNLAAEELFTNLVRHNVGGTEVIRVGLEITPERIEMELVDFDVEKFDPNSVDDVDVDRPAEEREPGGLGIHLVKSIVDRLTYAYGGGQMTVTVVKNRRKHV
jgi:serine/threonine-protein kinase RsbW